MAVPLTKTVATMAWISKEVRPMIASLTGQGHIKPVEGMELLEGLDGLEGLVRFFEKYGEQIKRNAVGQ